MLLHLQACSAYACRLLWKACAAESSQTRRLRLAGLLLNRPPRTLWHACLWSSLLRYLGLTLLSGTIDCTLFKS